MSQNMHGFEICQALCSIDQATNVDVKQSTSLACCEDADSGRRANGQVTTIATTTVWQSVQMLLLMDPEDHRPEEEQKQRAFSNQQSAIDLNSTFGGAKGGTILAQTGELTLE